MFGQLGVDIDDVPVDHNSPKSVLLPGHVQSISAGHLHSLFLLENGTVFAVGGNAQYQLGLQSGTTELSISQPQRVFTEFSGPVQAVSGGSGHSLFLLADGTVLAAGR